MRSKLFVPGARPELFAKALASEADALSFDLEDSVAESRKDEARANVAAFIQSVAAQATSKLVVVRVNALHTPHIEADLAAVARARVDLINLPKVESVQEVLKAVELLERAEAANGIQQPISLLANIESPRGLRMAAEIASSHPRIAGLQLGLVDLFEPHGIDRRDPANVHAAQYALRMAAAEAGIFAWDAAFADIDDTEGFRAEAAMARRLGFVGKSCIHPRQLALANTAFMPDADEVESARRIVAAAADATAAGRGAFVVDGRMVDLPFLKRAQAILASVDSHASEL